MRVPRRLAGAVLGLALMLTAAPARAQSGGLIALPPVGEGENLVTNPGLETTDGPVPTGWRARPEASFALDAGRTGRALRLRGADAGGPVATAEQTLTLEPGFYTIAAWVRTEALGTTSPRSGVRLCLDARPRLNWWNCTPVARATTPWTRISRDAIPVRDAGTYRVTVGAYGRPDGTAWIDDVAVTRLASSPVDVFLLYPNYRGMLFDDRPQAVRAAVRVARALPPGAARVRVSLVDESGGTARAWQEWSAGEARGRQLTATLDAAGLPAGDYLVRGQLLDASGAELSRYPDHRVVKAPAKTRETFNAWYDERNVTHLGGAPAFVLGLYTTSGYSTQRSAYATGNDGWGVARMAQAPINMVINYWLGATPMPALGVYMDELGSRGIRYLHTVNFHHEDDPQYRKLPYAAAGEGAAALHRWIGATLVKHPALAGFYTADERTAEMVPKVFRQHRELRRAAPGTVTYAVLGDGWQDQAPLWRDAADVLGLDPYPITRAGDNPLGMVGEWTRLGRDAVMDSRPLWMVIQFFPLTRQGGWPSRADLSTMSWMAIVEGARGLLYWSYGARGLAWVKDGNERVRHWEDLVAVTKEIKALEPVLLAPDVPLVREPGGARVLGKRTPDGARYLFAYNPTGAPLSVRWTIDGPAREAVALDGGAPVPVSGGSLAVEFSPYEVKRFRLR